MKKKRCKSLVGLVMLLLLMLVPQYNVYADGEIDDPMVDISEDVEEPTAGIGITLFSTYISTSNVNLSVSGNKATCTADVSGFKSSVIKTSIFMYLQKYNSSTDTWSTAASWSVTEDSHTASISKTAIITSGKYRVKASYWAYTASSSENVIKYSGTYTK